jgi:hypothetical protein
VRVHVNGETLGFLTPAMTKRHAPRVREALDATLRPTVAGRVRRDQHKEPLSWQITLQTALPDDTEVELLPQWVVNAKGRVRHSFGQQKQDGSWTTSCGAHIPSDSAIVLCSTHPAGRLVIQATGEAIPHDRYDFCMKCY